MPRLLTLAVLLLLAGCAGRAKLVELEGVEVDTPTRSVFLGTTRAFENGAFGSGRSPDVTFARYDISIPDQRSSGSIVRSRRAPDPHTQFFIRDIARFDDETAFRSGLRPALRAAGGTAVIYVHGFNNTFDEGILRITQLAEDFDMPGVALHYSWPSLASPVGYAHDRDSVLFARDGLERLIAATRAAGAREVIVVAHSVGSMLLMETLRQMAIARPGSVARVIDGVVLISPDLDIDLFRRQVARIGRLPTPFGIFVSRRDRVLTLSARLSGQKNRLGNVDRVDAVADLDVTIVDVTEFSRGAGHFTAATSPALIAFYRRAGALGDSFAGDRAGVIGLAQGTVLTVQNATSVILSPVAALAQ